MQDDQGARARGSRGYRGEPGVPQPPRGSVAAPRGHYRTPRLIEYGRLEDLTQAVGNDGFDGAIGSVDTT
jgi:hypothetical protein